MTEERTYTENEVLPIFIFDFEGVHFECVLKHLCAIHGLGWEWITTITSTQLVEGEGNCHDVLRKTMLISSVTSEVEEIIEEFMKEFMLKRVASATEQMRVSDADLKQFIWEYGHLVLAEEHFADYISLFVKRLDKASSGEREVLMEKILTTAKFLYVVRLERKKLFSGFLEKVVEKKVSAESDRGNFDK
ncbi:MAG: hypothetical protein QW734_02080 [Candidatus Bathyarchaeia archaeon]